MDERRLVRISRTLSYALRHHPEEFGIELAPGGWTDIDLLLNGLSRRGDRVTREEIEEVVVRDNKGRYSVSSDGRRIRANQGHSVEIDLGYPPTPPPPILFHGTAERFLDSILERGLLRGERHHVHLSADRKTALSVGQRYGRPVILLIRAAEMTAAGLDFFLSDNGVWLTEHVPVRYLEVEEGRKRSERE